MTFALPASYCENVLSLMFCSPTVLFVYWDFSEGRRTALAESSGVYLRVSGVDRRPAGSVKVPFYELPVSNEKQSSYLAVVPGETYACEIGSYTENGLYLPILISNLVTTPSLKISLSESKAFAEVAASKEDELKANSVHPVGYSSGMLIMVKEKSFPW